ncbi:MAG: hypothetical protein IJF03_11805 [Lachnospiraceae bacterium]|nr:hypothetical protein [Lachnospiraceae bacterium]
MKDNDTQYSKICFWELSKERKLEYIWDYYKFHILGILLLLALLIGSILIWQQNSKPTLINGYLLNTDWGDEQAQELLEKYAAFHSYDLENYNAYFNSSVYIDTSIKDQMSTVAYTKVMSDLDVKETDFYFCNQEMFDYFGQRETFLNLEAAMPQELYERFENQLITATIVDENGNETNGYVAGIDISDSPVLARLQQERKIYEDGTVYFTVPYNSERLEEVWKFLEFLYFE